MEDRTKNLEKAFKYVRTFYNEISQLLSDVIDLMGREGWDAPAGGVTDGLSYSLDYPDQWMCYYVYKNFTNDKTDSVKGIALFLDEYMNNFPVSIVCGKLADQPMDSFEKWGIYWLVMSNKDKLNDLTGEVISLSAARYGKTIAGDVFAIPLSDVRSSEDVKDKIIKRLLEL